MVKQKLYPIQRATHLNWLCLGCPPWLSEGFGFSQVFFRLFLVGLGFNKSNKEVETGTSRETAGLYQAKILGGEKHSKSQLYHHGGPRQHPVPCQVQAELSIGV